MRKAFNVMAAVLLFFVGGVWRVLDVVGRSDIAVKLPTMFTELAHFAAAHQDTGYQIAPWFLMGVSVLFLAYLQWPEIFRLPHKGREVASSTVELAATPKPEFISLTEAATISYERLREAGSIYATAADKLAYQAAGESRADATLDWFGYYLCPKLDVYGKHPPSRIQELIDRDEFSRGGLQKRATEFEYYNENEPRYVDLCVRKDAVDRLVQHVIDGEEEAFEDGFAAPSREAAILRLTKLRNDGVVIRNASSAMLFTCHLEEWMEDVLEWMNEVISTLSYVEVNDSEWFKVLGEVPAARVPIPNVRLGGKEDRQAFVATFQQHDFRLSRLDGLLKKYGVGA